MKMACLEGLLEYSEKTITFWLLVLSILIYYTQSISWWQSTTAMNTFPIVFIYQSVTWALELLFYICR